MAELLIIVPLAFVVACTATVVYGLHRLRRRNRVSPRVRCHAPLAWLVSPWPAARLHRRLRASVLATASCDGGPTVAELAGELQRQAVAIDGRLLVAHRSPSPVRRRLLADLQAEAREVEVLNERVVRLAARWSQPASSLPGSGGGVAAVRERLEALDAATRELAAG